MTNPIESRLDQLGFHHDMVEPQHRLKTGWFSWILVLSVSLNVAVVAFMVLQLQDGVLWFEVETEEPAAAPRLSQSESLKEEIGRLYLKSDDELLRSLDEEGVVANGYRVQELALALLRFRGYQIEDPLRPLGAWPQPMSTFSWIDADGKIIALPLFSTVGSREIQAVKAFLHESAVPFTSEGIVRRMKEGQNSFAMKATLLRADEWAIFARIFGSIPEAEQLSLCQDLGGEAFSSIVSWGRTHTDVAEAGPFLLTVFSKFPSNILAEYLSSKCADTVVLQAPDDLVILLYSSLPPQSEAGVRLAMRILHGQRKLPVWQASQAYLARAASLPTLSSMNRDQVLEWLQQMAHPTKTASPVQPPSTPSLLPKPVAPAQPPRQPDGVVKKTEIGPKPEASASSVRPLPQKTVAPKSSASSAGISSRVATRQLRPYRTYVVKKGDTLWSVARRFNVDIEKLKYLNGLKGATLVPGKVLRIPH